MDSATNFWTAKAALDWQIEMGVDEAICDGPVNRYDLKDKPKDVAPKTKAKAVPDVATAEPDIDAVKVATDAAKAAQDIDGLKSALSAFDLCPLKAAARNLVYASGTQGAPVMVVTDAPDRADDRAGSLMTGPAGVLFDQMFAAIGMARDENVCVAPVVPWNPPQNRDPSGPEIAMMLPFLQRHIEIADPKVIVLMGNAACHALLGRSGMTRLRGTWAEVSGRPALPIFPPSFLMANGAAKRDAWADLLSLKAKLRDFA